MHKCATENCNNPVPEGQELCDDCSKEEGEDDASEAEAESESGSDGEGEGDGDAGE